MSVESTAWQTYKRLLGFARPYRGLLLLAGVGNAPTHAAPIMNLVTTNMKNGNFGMSSAAGWFLFLMILVISLVELALMREKED